MHDWSKYLDLQEDNVKSLSFSLLGGWEGIFCYDATASVVVGDFFNSSSFLILRLNSASYC